MDTGLRDIGYAPDRNQYVVKDGRLLHFHAIPWIGIYTLYGLLSPADCPSVPDTQTGE